MKRYGRQKKKEAVKEGWTTTPGGMRMKGMGASQTVPAEHINARSPASTVIKMTKARGQPPIRIRPQRFENSRQITAPSSAAAAQTERMAFQPERSERNAVP